MGVQDTDLLGTREEEASCLCLSLTHPSVYPTFSALPWCPAPSSSWPAAPCPSPCPPPVSSQSQLPLLQASCQLSAQTTTTHLLIQSPQEVDLLGQGLRIGLQVRLAEVGAVHVLERWAVFELRGPLVTATPNSSLFSPIHGGRVGGKGSQGSHSHPISIPSDLPGMGLTTSSPSGNKPLCALQMGHQPFHLPTDTAYLPFLL